MTWAHREEAELRQKETSDTEDTYTAPFWFQSCQSPKGPKDIHFVLESIGNTLHKNIKKKGMINNRMTVHSCFIFLILSYIVGISCMLFI